MKNSQNVDKAFHFSSKLCSEKELTNLRFPKHIIRNVNTPCAIVVCWIPPSWWYRIVEEKPNFDCPGTTALIHFYDLEQIGDHED